MYDWEHPVILAASAVPLYDAMGFPFQSSSTIVSLVLSLLPFSLLFHGSIVFG